VSKALNECTVTRMLTCNLFAVANGLVLNCLINKTVASCENIVAEKKLKTFTMDSCHHCGDWVSAQCAVQ